MNTVLEIENVSKQYRLGEVGTGSLQNDLKRWWYQLRGKEDPFLKIGETNDRTTKGHSDYVWALKDINFKVEQGQAIGIIGRNGAGKSTLLKLLSRVTKPTTGTIKYKGRIASLLEVGTGFHPEMTGRENIYLNGAILGMTRKEITRKFDEIVAFAGVERYVDTPVKRYSSGMYVRLAFAVAAFLESEILIVDEVLAVGDAEFQKKCIGKMNDVSKGEGRTVLFVSHNMASVRRLCDKSVVLEYGCINYIGDVITGINKYVSNTFQGGLSHYELNSNNQDRSYVQRIWLTNNTGQRVESISSLSENYFFDFKIRVSKGERNLNFGCTLFDLQGEPIVSFPIFEDFEGNETNHIKIKIPTNILVAGEYYLQGSLWVTQGGEIESNDRYLNIKVEPRYSIELQGGAIKAKIMSPYCWIK